MSAPAFNFFSAYKPSEAVAPDFSKLDSFTFGDVTGAMERLKTQFSIGAAEPSLPSRDTYVPYKSGAGRKAEKDMFKGDEDGSLAMRRKATFGTLTYAPTAVMPPLVAPTSRPKPPKAGPVRIGGVEIKKTHGHKPFSFNLGLPAGGFPTASDFSQAASAGDSSRVGGDGGDGGDEYDDDEKFLRGLGLPSTGGAVRSHKRTGGSKKKRTGGSKKKRTGGSKKKRTGGGSKKKRTGGGSKKKRTGGGSKKKRTGGSKKKRTGGSKKKRTGR